MRLILFAGESEAKVGIVDASVLEDIDLNRYTKGNEAELNKTETSDSTVKLDNGLGDYCDSVAKCFLIRPRIS